MYRLHDLFIRWTEKKDSSGKILLLCNYWMFKGWFVCYLASWASVSAIIQACVTVFLPPGGQISIYVHLIEEKDN